MVGFQMTVADLIEWLKTQDQGATVQVVKHSSHGASYYEQGGTATVVEFDPTDVTHHDYTDFRENQYVKPDAAYFNQRYLLLGEHNG